MMGGDGTSFCHKRRVMHKGNSSDLPSQFYIQLVMSALNRYGAGPVSRMVQALSQNPAIPRPTHACLSAGYLDTGIRLCRTSPTCAGVTV